MIDLIFFGVASRKIYKKIKLLNKKNESILEVARKQNIPIASSCSGQGHCLKCISNSGKDLLCQITVNDLEDGKTYIYNIDYL